MFALGIYPHLFWSPDPNDGYNCSNKSYDEWAKTGTSSPFLGSYYLFSGTIVMVLYFVIVWAMTNSETLQHPCYKLMYFNCFIDMVNIVVNSFAFGVMLYQGAVFCTHPKSTFIFGSIALGCWCSSCFNCIAIAINRCSTMFNHVSSIFAGNFIYVWPATSIALMLSIMFFTRPTIFNSALGAYFYYPFIQDIEIEASLITNVIHPCINGFTAVVINLLYFCLFLHFTFSKNSHFKDNSLLSRAQKALFIQCLATCLTTSSAAVVYIYMQFFYVPHWLVTVASLAYQMCSIVPCFAYLTFNSAVRARVKRISGLSSIVPESYFSRRTPVVQS